LNQWIVMGVSVLAGAAIPLQAAANAKLGVAMPQPLWAAFIALTVSSMAILAVLLLNRTPLPEPEFFAGAPVWSWFGGLGGAIFIAAGVYFVPQIGAANFLVATVAGQLLLAAIVDHRGWLGVPSSTIDSTRIGGLALILIGAYLFAFKR
jgi:transporter family-2 protein